MSKNKIEFGDIYLAENGMWKSRNEKIKHFTQEEVDSINKDYYNKQEECLKEIIEDGYIQFDVLYDKEVQPLWGRCFVPSTFIPSCAEGFKEKFGMRFNIYIPSYKRAGITLTDKMLDMFGVKNYYLCIDPDQYTEYKKHYPKEHLIIRDWTLKSEEKVDLASSIITPDYLHGPCGVFNSLLYLARATGETHYWTIDDDMMAIGIRAFKGGSDGLSIAKEKYQKENWYRCSALKPEYGFNFIEFMNDLEEISLKTRNGGMVALEKYGLAFALPISWKMGTRAFSYYLTNVEKQCNHIGTQNNDIITSLEMGKHGYSNIIFEGYGYASLDTQSQKGGVSDVYRVFGTLDKGKVLVQAQPNYSKISNVYNRIHHTVDFNQYNKIRLLGDEVRKE